MDWRPNIRIETNRRLTPRIRPRKRALTVSVLALAALTMSYGGIAVTRLPLDLVATNTAATTGWTSQPPLNLARAGHDVATVDGRILALGGFDPTEPDVFNSMEGRRVSGTGTWHTLAPMPTARANPAAAELGGAVYVSGGFSNEGPILDVVERYNPSGGTWTASTNLPVPRAAAGSAGLGGLLYVAGGYVPAGDADAVTASVVAFDPTKRTWTSVAPLATARARLRLVATGGHLYAIGGQSAEDNTLSTVERYDPRSNKWTTVAAMNQDRGLPGAVAVNHGTDHLIVVVGGCQFVSGQLLGLRPTTEVYNTATDKWHLLQVQLPSGRCSLGAATDADGRVLAIGGAIDMNGPTATAAVDALQL
jgi:N-acetylneuraminic acid mutarotase